MARTSTRVVIIDDHEYKLAKLTIGALRDVSDREKEIPPDDGFAILELRASAVLTSMKRADAACQLTMMDLLRQLDGDDLGLLFRSLMEHTMGREAPKQGESTSP